MSIDIERFKDIRDALNFKGNDHDLVYSLSIGFDGLEWIGLPHPAGYDSIIPILKAHSYEHVECEDFQEYCSGVFKFNDKYYKANWEYCKLACELDYWHILNEENFYEVVPEEKTITVWKNVAD